MGVRLSPRAPARNCKEFWAKKSVGGFELVKENFSFLKISLMVFYFPIDIQTTYTIMSILKVEKF